MDSALKKALSQLKVTTDLCKAGRDCWYMVERKGGGILYELEAEKEDRQFSVVIMNCKDNSIAADSCYLHHEKHNLRALTRSFMPCVCVHIKDLVFHYVFLNQERKIVNSVYFN